jgi:hypothetical protein
MKGDTRPVNFSKPRETPVQTGAAYARRQLLRMIASGAAVFPAWAKAFAVDKLAKSDLDYRDRPKGKERCDNCDVWLHLRSGQNPSAPARLAQYLATSEDGALISPEEDNVSSRERKEQGHG